MKLIDTHNHLYLEDFDPEQDQLITVAKESGIDTLLFPNVDTTTIERMHDLCDRYPDFAYPMMGLHPTSVDEHYAENLKVTETWLGKRSYCGIGEIGIDLYWDKTYLKEQKDVTGMILKESESDGDNIHAIAVSQILPLVERLANGEKARYTGIYGTEIDQAQCRHLGIGQGLYIERTEKDSPAMKAGLQSGDIISKIDGNLTESMQSYYTYLQTKKAGEKITVTVLRKNSKGDYVEKDYQVLVEER